VAHIFLAIIIGVVGVFVLASGFGAYPGDFNWFGQFCYAGVCIHPEWIAIGAGLIACAVVVFVVLKPERKERWP
jgi:divalent metal cation (Fe/Co/Zn/Cd) transporter